MPVTRGLLRSLVSVQGNVRLFRLFGINFMANWSWGLLLLLLLAYAAAELFGSVLDPTGRAYAWPLAIVAALLSVASLYGHELAHALVARAHGVQVKAISLFLMGGAAHIIQESPSPRAELLIALSGPAVSVAIGALGVVVSATASDVLPGLGALGLWLALVNLPLAGFNMVPAYPLDGGRALRGLLWFAGKDLPWASAVAARFGQVGAAGLLLAGLYGIFTTSTSIASGLWLVLIAWFVHAGSVGAHRATMFRDLLTRLTVAAVMQRNLGRIDAATTLRSFAEEHASDQQIVRDGYPRTYGVYRDEQIIGLVSAPDLRGVPAPQWATASVEQVMLAIDRAPTLDPGASAVQALQILLGENLDRVVVVAEDRLLGVVTRADLARAATQRTG